MNHGWWCLFFVSMFYNILLPRRWRMMMSDMACSLSMVWCSFLVITFVLFLLRTLLRRRRKSLNSTFPLLRFDTHVIVYWKLVTSNKRRPRVSITRHLPFTWGLDGRAKWSTRRDRLIKAAVSIRNFRVRKFGRKRKKTKRALSLIKGHKFWFWSRNAINVLINVRWERRKITGWYRVNLNTFDLE